MDWKRSGNAEINRILEYDFLWDACMLEETEGCTAEVKSLADSSTAVILTVPGNGKPGGDFTETVLTDGHNMLWTGDFGTFAFESVCENDWLTLPYDRPVLIENRLLPMPDLKFDGRWNTVRFLLGLRHTSWYLRLDDAQKARLAQLLHGGRGISPDDVLYPERETCDFLIRFIKSSDSPREWWEFFDGMSPADRKLLNNVTYLDVFQTYERVRVYHDGFWAVLHMLQTAAEKYRQHRAIHD